MAMYSLYDLFLNELKDIYSAEKQALRALPRMAKAADSAQLRRAFERHAQETQVQIERLEQIFDMLEEKGTGKKCKGMEGLVEEGKEVLDEEGDPAVLDAALIAAAQRVEHYEIAAYGCVRNYAELLELPKAVKLLQRTLDEEEKTDALLTKLAESGINEQAALVGAEEEEEE